MKSWTRTLNLDDAHTLLALAEPGMALDVWTKTCHAHLPELSAARRRELVRMLRDGFLTLNDDDELVEGLFLHCYATAPAVAQIDLVQLQWALSHPLSLAAIDTLVAPALRSDDPNIPLSAVEDLVAAHLATSSQESRRKTRTVLLGALEGIGVLQTRGTGQHRALRASHGSPHPVAFGYLVRRDLAGRGAESMMTREALESSLAARATLCPPAHAQHALAAAVQRGLLWQEGDEVGVPGMS